MFVGSQMQRSALSVWAWRIFIPPSPPSSLLPPSSCSPLLLSLFSSYSSPYSFFLLLVQILWCDMSKIRLETTQNPMYQIKVVDYKKNSLITFLPPSFAKTKNQKEIRGERERGERGEGRERRGERGASLSISILTVLSKTLSVD